MSLRDDLAQVIRHAYAQGMVAAQYDDDLAGTLDEWHPEADAVIAHLGLTEETRIPPYRRKQRRYVTPWEDA